MGTAEPSVTFSIVVCVASCVLSTWCVLHNKYIFQHVFHNSNGVLLFQNVVTLAALSLGRRARWLDFHVSLRSRGDLLSGVCYTCNVVAGLWSLSFVSVPIFGVLKRLTAICSWGFEYTLNRRPTTGAELLPVLGMVTAAVVAGANDLQFNLAGYALGGLSCFSQAASFEIGRHVAQAQNKGICAVLYANSVVCLGVLSVYLVGTGELWALLSALRDPVVAGHLALNGLSCLALNYSIYLDCTVNSPLVHTVAANVKSAVTTLLSVFVFAALLRPAGWAGIAGSFACAAWFSLVKYRAKVAESEAAPEPSRAP